MTTVAALATISAFTTEGSCFADSLLLLIQSSLATAAVVVVGVMQTSRLAAVTAECSDGPSQGSKGQLRTSDGDDTRGTRHGFYVSGMFRILRRSKERFPVQCNEVFS